jgi:hypothetical protein
MFSGAIRKISSSFHDLLDEVNVFNIDEEAGAQHKSQTGDEPLHYDTSSNELLVTSNSHNLLPRSPKFFECLSSSINDEASHDVTQ